LFNYHTYKTANIIFIWFCCNKCQIVVICQSDSNLKKVTANTQDHSEWLLKMKWKHFCVSFKRLPKSEYLNRQEHEFFARTCDSSQLRMTLTCVTNHVTITITIKVANIKINGDIKTLAYSVISYMRNE